MNEYLMFFLGVLAGGAFVAWRMKGTKTWRQTGAVILGGGGPSNEK